MHSSQELLEVLAVCRHLLAVAVEGVLLLILVRSASVSILIMGHPWRMPPSLARAHLLMARTVELLLVLPLAPSAHVLLVLAGSHLLLPAMLVVAWVGLYVVQLLVDQVELSTVVVDVVFVVDTVLAVIYYLFLDQIATLA